MDIVALQVLTNINRLVYFSSTSYNMKTIRWHVGEHIIDVTWRTYY